MDTKYRLVLQVQVGTARKPASYQRTFVWDDKQDALDCKDLLDKAEHMAVSLRFEEFSEPIPL